MHSVLNAAVLQTVAHTLLASRPMLVVPTGLEPAISCLKDRWLSQFAYDTMYAM